MDTTSKLGRDADASRHGPAQSQDVWLRYLIQSAWNIKDFQQGRCKSHHANSATLQSLLRHCKVPVNFRTSRIGSVADPATTRGRPDWTGTFDVHVEWAPDQSTPGILAPDLLAPDLGPPDADATDPNGKSIFTALLEQLGLKLESTKGPVEFLVIDHLERPSEN